MKHIKFKENLLEDYSKNDPTLLIKYKGHGYENESLQEEYEVSSSIETELQLVTDVVILINPRNSTREDALFLISQIAEQIGKDKELFGKAMTANEEYDRSCEVNRKLNIIADELLGNLSYQYSFEQLEYIFDRVKKATLTEVINRS